MIDRYTAEGNRVFCDGRYFCFAVTDRAARLAADALNQFDPAPVEPGTWHTDLPPPLDPPMTVRHGVLDDQGRVTWAPPVDLGPHGDDCTCVSCAPPYEDAGAIDEATGCPNAYRVEGDERVCTRPGCGVRWSHDEDRPPCR